MSDAQLERLRLGIKAASDAGDTESVRKLGLAYRAAQQQAGGGQPAPVANDGLSGALVTGWDNAGLMTGKGIEGLGQLFGSDTLKDFGAGQAAANEAELAASNYQRPQEFDGIWRNLKEGDLYNAGGSLLYGATENIAPLAAGVAATAGALGATLLTGGTALAAGGVAVGGAGLTATQALGESRLEKADKGVDDTASYTDLATAVASGVIELVPVGKGAGFTLKFAKEGLQEAAQEGLVIGGTAVQGGEYVPQEVGERLFDAGVTGGVVSKGMDLTVRAGAKALDTYNTVAAKAVDKLDDLRYDDTDFEADDARTAARLMESADDNMDTLGNVDDAMGDNTARGAANAALRRVRSEVEQASSNLLALSKETDGDEASVAIKTLKRIAQHQQSSLPDEFVTALSDSFGEIQSKFGNIREVQELSSLVKQHSKISEC